MQAAVKFVKKHKYPVAVGVAVLAVAIGAFVIIKRRRRTVSPSPTDPAKYTTGADPGYGDAADIDGKSELRGYRKGSRVPSGPFQSYWSASRNTNMLIVDSPKAMDGGSPGIREEAEAIAVPLPGWEDSNIKDLVVKRQQQNMALDGENKIAVIVSTIFGKSGTVNVLLTREDGKTFPKGFVVPTINAELGPKGSEEEML